MRQIRKVAVFCGSNTGLGDQYEAGAIALGTALGRAGLGVVYGGTQMGLMKLLADAALAQGSNVHGVIVKRLHDKGQAHEGLSLLDVAADMRERKEWMADAADAFIAMPGGIGTLEEAMEAWTLNQLGEIDKPLGLYNVGGFYDGLMSFIDQMVGQAFLPQTHRDWIAVNDEPDALIRELYAQQPAAGEKWL